MILVQDTETSGLLNFKKDLMDTCQPRIVQLACVLCNLDGEILESLSAIIKPDGWDSIEEGALSVHGITIDRCNAEGRPMREVLAEYQAMKDKCTSRAGYNITYDKRMIKREEIIYDMVTNSDHLETIDVMHLATPLCKLAPTDKMMAAGRKTFKTAKLAEAYECIIGKPFERAHDAMSDVMATKEIYFKIKGSNVEKFERPSPDREEIKRDEPKPEPITEIAPAAAVGEVF